MVPSPVTLLSCPPAFSTKPLVTLSTHTDIPVIPQIYITLWNTQSPVSKKFFISLNPLRRCKLLLLKSVWGWVTCCLVELMREDRRVTFNCTKKSYFTRTLQTANATRLSGTGRCIHNSAPSTPLGDHAPIVVKCKEKTRGYLKRAQYS